jgi:hypothetical protein
METDTFNKIKTALASLKTSEVKWDEDKDTVEEEPKYPTVDISGILGATGSTSTLYNTVLGSSNYGNVTINSSGSMGIGTSASNYYYSTGAGNVAVGTLTGSSGLHVRSDAEFEGDIKWKGRSLGKLLVSIEDRLAILSEPDPVKLEKFAALKKAYDHYKLMEKLIGDDTDVNS